MARKKEVQEAKGGCVLQLLGLVVVGIIFFAMCDGKPKPKPVPTVAPQGRAVLPWIYGPAFRHQIKHYSAIGSKVLSIHCELPNSVQKLIYTKLLQQEFLCKIFLCTRNKKLQNGCLIRLRFYGTIIMNYFKQR